MQNFDIPHLPVPNLDQTLEKYEYHLQPLLDEARRTKVHEIIQKFGSSGGLGPKLQLYLLEKQKSSQNWVSLI